MSRMGGLVLDRLRWIAGAKAGPAAVAQSVVTRFFLVFVNLATGVFTARHLGSDGRGEQAAMALWLPIFTYVLTFGVPIALCFQGRKHPEDTNRLFGSALVIAVGTGTLAMISGIVLMPKLLHNYGPANIADARLIMYFAPLGMLSLVFTAMLEVRLDFTFSNFTRYAPPLLTLATLVILAARHTLTPFHAVLAYVVPVNAITLVTAVYLFRRTRVSLVDFRRSARRLFGYGVRVYGADIFSTFGQQVDQLLVVGLLSAGELGWYAIALQASRVLTIFQVSLNYVLLPKAAGLPTHRVLELVARSARLTIAVTSLAGLMLVIVLPFLLPAVYGRDFAASVAVSQILAIEAVVTAAASTHTQAFMATNRPGMSTFFQVSGLAAAIPLMLVLIPRFGLIGAAFSLLASTTLRLLLALFSYPILLKAPIPSLIVKRTDLDYLFGALKRKAA